MNKKIHPVKVNLSTSPDDLVATIKAELPKARYFFMKEFGGRRRYEMAEATMVEKALRDKEDQISHMVYWVSQAGNKWCTYTHVKYYSKANYVHAFKFSFIYYETASSCGAFFPQYSQDHTKREKGTPEGVIIFSGHFFYQMSVRTNIDYRSKNLICKFVRERVEDAISINTDGQVTLRFRGGYGFGRVNNQNPLVIEVRTFLTDKQLSNKQKERCKQVDAFYELNYEGMTNDDIAINALLNDEYTDEQLVADSSRRREALEKLGLGHYASFYELIVRSYVYVLYEILHVELNVKQMSYCSYVISEHSQPFFKKYLNADFTTKEQNDEFMEDMITLFVKCARSMQLKNVNRASIVHVINKALTHMHDKPQ